MNTKAVAVGAIIILAAVVGAFIYLNQPKAPVDPWAGKGQAYIGDFTHNLAGADEVFFVMDLRGANITTQRNIMQCNADMAFSSALGGKRKEIYSLDTECLRIGDTEGDNPVTLALSQCLSEIDAARGNLSKSIFYVRNANETMVFENELVVGMNDNYTYMGCSISAGSQQAANQTNQTAASVNQSAVEHVWQGLTNGTRAGSNASNGTSN